MIDRAITDGAREAGLNRALQIAPEEVAAAWHTASAQAAAMRGLMVAGPAVAAVGVPASPTVVAKAAVTPDALSLVAINAAFRAGTLTPPALVEAVLDRIAALDPSLDSFVLVDRDGARAAARGSAERWARGAALGPLDGVPVGVKDVIDVSGMPTRCHSRVTSDAPVREDAAIVAHLRAAGAVILGKLATHEFAIGGPAFDLPFPPARNPWNRDHHPGGSSSGAGAAVAAGLVPLAIGTDTAGSVRNPASACWVVGLKPGYGMLSCEGVVPLAPSLDHVGLLTRDAADMAVAAGVLGIATESPLGRVGYVRHFHTRDMTATPDVAAALDRAAATLGAVEVTLPPLGDFALVNRIILQTEGYAEHGAHLRERPSDLSYLTRAALLPGAFTRPETMAMAMAAKKQLTVAVDAVFQQVDVLLTASSTEPPCRLDDPAEIARSYMLQARAPFNVTGHPALAMGAGLSAEGLPLSVQFAARFGEEGRLLAAAAAWEAAMGGAMTPPIS